MSTYEMPDGEGKVRKLPMLRGGPPPCSTCPKLEGVETKAPLPVDEDLFGSTWFWDARQYYRRSKAVGDFGRTDELTLDMIVEFDEAASQQRIDQTAHRTASYLAKALPR